MAINLQKGQTINLRKEDNDLSRVTIGLGWDMKKAKGGFLSGIFGGKKDDDYDLDAICFMLDDQDKVANLGRELDLGGGRKMPLVQSDIIYYNNLTAPTGNFGAFQGLSKGDIQRKVQQFMNNGEYIIHTGDNLTGEGDGDDEQIIVRLDLLPPRIHKIIFLVTIYQGKQKNQHFGMLENAFIRAVDAKGSEIARYALNSDATFNGMCTMVFAELYRKDGGWKFRALGEARESDFFVHVLRDYLYS